MIAPVYLWEVLVPHKMGPKGRKVIHVSYHQVWDDFVRQVAGGLTIMKAAKGQWVNTEEGGRVYKELMIPVRIACTRDQLDEILRFTVKHYRQHAVMAYKVSEEVIIQRGAFTRNDEYTQEPIWEPV